MTTTPGRGPSLYLLQGGVLYPVLPAALTPSRKQAHVWCRYCDKLHYHGPCSGHRVAHCYVRDSPYLDHGYILQLRAGLRPEDLVPPRSERRRPRRRGGQLRHAWVEEVAS